MINLTLTYNSNLFIEPAVAPPNVRGRNTSSTSILVLWDGVPVVDQNGIITGYTINYQSQTENDSANVPADANKRQKELTGLKEYVDYNITVFASTAKGAGPKFHLFLLSEQTRTVSGIVCFKAFVYFCE